MDSTGEPLQRDRTDISIVRETDIFDKSEHPAGYLQQLDHLRQAKQEAEEALARGMSEAATAASEAIQAIAATDWGDLCRFVVEASEHVLGEVSYLGALLQDNEDITRQIETVLRSCASMQVVVPHPAEVHAYLVRYPDMVDLVETVCRIAADRFADHVQLALEVYHDPEIQDEYLTLYVRQDPYDEQVLTTMDEVSAQCEALLTGKAGWLLVTTDFCPPK